MTSLLDLLISCLYGTPVPVTISTALEGVQGGRADGTFGGVSVESQAFHSFVLQAFTPGAWLLLGTSGVSTELPGKDLTSVLDGFLVPTCGKITLLF